MNSADLGIIKLAQLYDIAFVQSYKSTPKLYFTIDKHLKMVYNNIVIKRDYNTTARAAEDKKMRKYNMSNIMKRAWAIVKTAGDTISNALKEAWAKAKSAVEKVAFKGYAKVAKMENPYDEDCCFFTFKKWEKYGKSRIYINDYKGRTIGYIEKGDAVIKDRQGNREEQIEFAINGFFAKYAI